MEQVKQPQQSSSSESQTTPNRQEQSFYKKEDDNLEPELVKKMCLETPYQQNDLKTDKAQQESIIQSIENTNIQRIVSEAMNKFDPPYCGTCPSRKADKICINKACGNSFMQLICGKCHYEKHRDSVTKPEIDIEEYFTKLAQFMNSTEHDSMKNIKKQQIKSQLMIDKDNLSTSIGCVNQIRQKLAIIKEILLKEYQEYVPPTQIISNMQNSITQALNIYETENIKQQLNLIKHNVIFQKNCFQWNGADKKQMKIINSINQLDVSAEQLQKIISNSIISAKVDLTDCECIYGKINMQSSKSRGSTDFKLTDEREITMVNTQGDAVQAYINYQLNPSSKYRLIFKFNNYPSKYIVTGVFPLSQIKAYFQYTFAGHFFCKRFQSPCATHECSRILKGKDLSSNLNSTIQRIEMRVDFQNNYMDFSDYPDHKNVNANHLKSYLLKEPYVFTFNLDDTSRITIETIEELAFLEEYC